MTKLNHAQAELPQGAARCTEWIVDCGERYRFVCTDEQRFDDRESGVYIAAIQHPNGMLSADDPVEILVHVAGNESLSATQARLLAQILLEAAELADKWTMLQSR